MGILEEDDFSRVFEAYEDWQKEMKKKGGRGTRASDAFRDFYMELDRYYDLTDSEPDDMFGAAVEQSMTGKGFDLFGHEDEEDLKETMDRLIEDIQE